MKALSYLYYFLLIISTLCLTTCNIDDDPIDDQDIPESIISSKTVVIGAQGGMLVYDDGTTLVVPKGVLTSDYTVTISKIANEQIFGSVENRNCYDISGLPIGTKVDLTFPCPPDKDPEYVAVFNYDPETIEGEQPAFSYDKNVGSIKITNFTLRNPPNQLIQKKRWIVEWGDKPEFGSESKLIPMPYYMQVGGTCWAADATMLAKAYMPYTDESTEVEIKDFLKEMQIGVDAGIDHWSFMKVLYKKFNLLTGGAGGKTEGYFSKSNLLRAIIKRLDEDKPIIIWLPNLESAHAVLIVGYRTVLNSSGYNDYELILHDSKATDPPNKDEGTMYTYRKWKWFIEGAAPTTFYMIMYAGSPVHSARALQTIGFPQYPSEMQLKFEKVVNNKKSYIYCKIDPTQPSGYGWVAANYDKVQYIEKVKTLIMNLQLYNADLDKAKDCNVNVKLTNLKTNKQTLSKDYPVQLGTDKKPKMLNITLDTSLWLKNEGDTSLITYRIDCKLTSEFGGDYLDGWNAEFKTRIEKPAKKNYLKFLFYYIGVSGSKFDYDFDWEKLKNNFTFIGYWNGNTYKYSETYINEQNNTAGFVMDAEFNATKSKILNLTIKFTLNNIEVVLIKGSGLDVTEVNNEYTYIKNGSSACNNLSQITFDYGTGQKFTGFCEPDSYFNLKIQK